jgi:hypothetical protein
MIIGAATIRHQIRDHEHHEHLWGFVEMMAWAGTTASAAAPGRTSSTAGRAGTSSMEGRVPT